MSERDDEQQRDGDGVWWPRHRRSDVRRERAGESTSNNATETVRTCVAAAPSTGRRAAGTGERDDEQQRDGDGAPVARRRHQRALRRPQQSADAIACVAAERPWRGRAREQRSKGMGRAVHERRSAGRAAPRLRTTRTRGHSRFGRGRGGRALSRLVAVADHGGQHLVRPPKRVPPRQPGERRRRVGSGDDVSAQPARVGLDGGHPLDRPQSRPRSETAPTNDESGRISARRRSVGTAASNEDDRCELVPHEIEHHGIERTVTRERINAPAVRGPLSSAPRRSGGTSPRRANESAHRARAVPRRRRRREDDRRRRQ